jgi:hypothetical protein
MAATDYADPAEVADLAAGMKQTHLECRTWNHIWRPNTAALATTQRWYDVTMRCVRCRSLRVQTWSLSGTVVTSHYEYAEGYLNKGLGRIVGDGRDALRLEIVQRAVAGKHTTPVVAKGA